MEKVQILKLKLEIYKTVYSGVILDSKYIEEEIEKLKNQLEILEV